MFSIREQVQSIILLYLCHVVQQRRYCQWVTRERRIIMSDKLPYIISADTEYLMNVWGERNNLKVPDSGFLLTFRLVA